MTITKIDFKAWNLVLNISKKKKKKVLSSIAFYLKSLKMIKFSTFITNVSYIRLDFSGRVNNTQPL